MVVARRLQTRWAELDLVCREGGTLVAVEVKTGRASARFRPAMRVRRDALERLGRAVRDLARGAPWRVDVCEVRIEAGVVRCVHLRDFRTPL